jgi:hypothetical protein
MADTTNNAKGPPKTIPIVPATNITKALGPSFKIPLKSILKVNNTNDAGSKYLEATLYKPEDSPEMTPNELKSAGMK